MDMFGSKNASNEATKSSVGPVSYTHLIGFTGR